MFFERDGAAERLVFTDWKPKEFNGVPFALVDPQGDKQKNVIMLHGPHGQRAADDAEERDAAVQHAGEGDPPAQRRRRLGLPVRPNEARVSMIVRLHYADGKTEDHELKNGVHFADYIRRVDVPECEFAFALRAGSRCAT